MQITNLNIDRYGEWTNTTLNEFSNGLNVFYGADANGKSAACRFLRNMLFGFDDQQRRQQAVEVGQIGGSLGLSGPFGKQVIRRYDRGHLDDQLTIEQANGTIDTSHRLHDLIGGLERSDFDRVFAFGFRDGRNIDHLVDGALSGGFDLVGGDENAARLQELNSILYGCRDQLSRLAVPSAPLESLRQRRFSLQQEIDHAESLTHQGRDNWEQRLKQLALEIGEWEDRIDILRDELVATEMELEQHRAERHPQSLQQTPVTYALSERQRKSLTQLNDQLERWTRLLKEIVSRREALQAEADDKNWKGPYETGDIDPRRYLRRLESRLDELQSRLDGWEEDNEWHVPVAGPSRTELSDSLREMRDDVYRLCRHFNYWETDWQQTQCATELGHLQRCEAELRHVIDGLSRRRRKLWGEINERLGDETSLLDPAHEGLCVCEEHPTLASTGFRAVESSHDDASAEWEAEHARMESRCLELRREIQEVSHKLSDVKRQRLDLENSSIPDAAATLDGLHRQMRLLEGEIESGREYDQLLSRIRTLEDEIREAKQAGRQPLVVREASEFVAQLTRGAVQRIRVTNERTVWLMLDDGKWVAVDQLPLGRRDQVYLSLCLALVAAYGREGVRLPMVLDDPFTNFAEEDVDAAIRLLRSFADRGRQVFVFTARPHLANRFRAQNEFVRNLPVYGKRIPRIEPNIQQAFDADVNWELDKACADELLYDDLQVVDAAEEEELPEEMVQYYLWETSPIEDAPSIDAAAAERFRKIGVTCIRDLLRVEASDAASRLRLDEVSAEMVRRWQAESLLVCHVPRLRHYDARLLVACGVTDPEQLAYMHPNELKGRIRALASTSAGRLVLRSGSRHELSRVAAWIRSAKQFRRDDDGQDGDSDRSRHRRRSSRDRHSSRSSRENTASRRSRSQRTGRSRSERRGRNASVAAEKHASGGWRHYLNRSDDVEEAPSIGPKTAERLEAIGIKSVNDLLEADAEQVARRMKHRRVKADTVRQWQQQTTLCCCIPELRGHDSQILVACGITDPETLAEMPPDDLWQVVEPFVETIEGKRIIRNGTTPDFQEVSDWIAWAGKARSLRAA